MVAGRAYAAKGIFNLARHHEVNRLDRGTCGMQRGIEAIFIHGGIAIKLYEPGIRGLPEYPFHIFCTMRPAQLLFIDSICFKVDKVVEQA